MHIDHDHLGGPCQDNCHAHVHTHADGTTHTHVHQHSDCEQVDHNHTHGQQDGCSHDCANCATPHTPMEELTALMRYMAGHNAAHTRELAELAKQLEQAGSHTAYEQVMAAVSDFEKGNLRLSAVLASLDA